MSNPLEKTASASTAAPGDADRVRVDVTSHPSAATAQHDNGARSGALVVPRDPALLQATVCGVPIFLRMVCVLERTTRSVHVLRTPGCTDSVWRDIQRVIASRPAEGRVVCVDSPDAVPTGAGLFVVSQPGAFDPRACAAIDTVPDARGKILRILRPGEDQAVLWFIGSERAAELVGHLAGTPDTAAALADFLSRQPVEDVDPGPSLCQVISNDATRRVAEEKLLAQARKDSDSWVARHFDRKISIWITKRLLQYPITANQVTVVATALGLGGAALLALGTYMAQVIGAALLVVSIVLDGCDGEIARLKLMESEFGRKFDFFLDNIVNVLAIFAVGAGYYRQGGPPFYLYASFASAGAALASVLPVYWLFFRKAKPAVDSDRQDRFNVFSLTESIAGRDFVYLVFVLALIGKAHWFVIMCLGGIGVFLAFVLGLLAVRLIDRPRRIQALRQAQGRGEI